MKQEEIIKAFEVRWRFKTANSSVAWVKGVKDLCFAYFQAGVLLSQSPVCCDSVTTSEDESFEQWWKLYDLKVGKEKCIKKWAKLTEKERKECIAATPAYVASTPDKQFRKRPLTYLNGKSWNDEIIIRNADNKPTIEQQRLDKLADIITG